MTVRTANKNEMRSGENEPQMTIIAPRIKARGMFMSLIKDCMLEKIVPRYSLGILFWRRGLKLICQMGHIRKMIEYNTINKISPSISNKCARKTIKDMMPIIDMAR